MLNHRLRCQPQVRASQCRGHVWMPLGRALYVRLVDDRLFPRNTRRLIVLPGKRLFDHGTQRRIRSTVGLRKRQVALLAVHIVSIQTFVPLQRTANRFSVRIQQHLVWIESVSCLGVIRTIDTIAIELTRTQIYDVAMPHRPSLLGQFEHMTGLPIRRVLKQQQFYFFSMSAVQGKVDTNAVPCSAPWIRHASSDPQSILNALFQIRLWLYSTLWMHTSCS